MFSTDQGFGWRIKCKYDVIYGHVQYFVSIFVVVGGEVCRIGGRWVVNPSGGLESKGTFNQVTAKPLVAMVYLRIGSCLACVYRVMDARGKFGE